MRKTTTSVRGYLRPNAVVLCRLDAMQYIVRAAGMAASLGDAIHPHMLRHGAGYALINVRSAL
jgi:hypothetical protein